MTKETPHASGMQRSLAFTAAGLVLASLAAIVAVIAATPFGVADNDGFSKGVWPAILVFPEFALPLGFILVILLFTITAVRRGRTNRTR